MARIRQRLRGWRGLLADARRLPAALLVWNIRKTLYRFGGPEARCPCQHPSDSGRAFETHCDAAADWHGAGRFRIVCPLVRTTGDGFVCSVNAADVRPFWGRAIAISLVALICLYVVGATVGFATLRVSGNREVTWLDVAWPQRWPRIAQARSRYFTERGITALADHDYALARISFESAIASDPHNYDASLLLAMLHTLGASPAAGDAAFEWLLDRYPQQALRSAVMYHDLLLANGRLDRLAPFAAWMARHDPAHSASWVRALLVSLRQTGNAGAFAKDKAAILRQLDHPARALIATEILIQQNQIATVRGVLQRPPEPDASPIYSLLQIEQLLRLGDTAGATVIKNAASTALGPVRSLALQFLIEQKANNPVFARTCFARLTAGELNESDLDWLVSVLLRAPDRESFARLDQRLRTRPLDGSPAAIGGSMWTAALVCGDAAAVGYWADFLRQRAHLEVPAVSAIDFDTLSPREPRSVAGLLARLPLPRETGYALYSRVRVGAVVKH